jgi:sugar phosphate isomerase/epimerase
MIQTGLASVTFRKLQPEKIIRLAVKADLRAIEWGGDIHVPHGDVQTARKVCTMTKAAGLKVASYGSYYRVGCKPPESVEFEKVLESAIALEAPTIRVWAGNRGFENADESYWIQIIEDARRIADLAGQAGIKIAFEYHGETLTDTNEAVMRLLHGANHSNIYCYWQPREHESIEQHLTGIRLIEPWLANIHVFHWQSFEYRFALREGMQKWMQYMSVIQKTGRDHFMLLEFVRNDDPDQFLDDAETLKSIYLLSTCNP